MASTAEGDLICSMVLQLVERLERNHRAEPTCLPYPDDLARFVEKRSDKRGRR